ncbi:SH3 domain-containing protein [Stieleria mannarensis]|uniref:SH3 domain-containing protein n=1 Tax=Stieleria mannarensis TaxID=2755585 RepID=UPI001603EFDB|nr:SH3 domain-containing protein [Rhodopirellula sp. JC639]
MIRRSAMMILLMLLGFGPVLNLVAADAVAPDPAAELQQAIQAYQSAMDETNRDRRIEWFARAETLFTQAIASQRSRVPRQSFSPDLYLNQGNAALGAEHLGAAILAYRRALTVAPNHRRARQNLDFARTLLPDWVPTPEEDALSFGSIVDWTRSIRADQWLGIAAIVFFVTMALAAIYLRTEKPVVRNLAVVFALVWIGVLAKSWMDRRGAEQRDAVVMRAEVTARSADSIHAPPKFRQPVPAGVEVAIVDDRDDWVRVRLSDGREAWLPASAIEPVETSAKGRRDG